MINYKASIRMFEKGTVKDENKKLATLCAYFNRVNKGYRIFT
ncbi:hypothetical protein PN397_02995 [Peptostreptococcus anaerobius]|nr:hypothetical protein [Peptostreptococcus anaerobius]